MRKVCVAEQNLGQYEQKEKKSMASLRMSKFSSKIK